MLSLVTIVFVSNDATADPSFQTPREFALYDVQPKGWEHPKQVERLEVLPPDNHRVLHNVTQPTLTALLPAPSKATGTGVLVFPGGGFSSLSIDEEGFYAARWLAARGMAAFVLKYRVYPELAEKGSVGQAVNIATQSPLTGSDAILPGELVAEEDARAAFALVRRRAREFGVDPERLGVVGFSAGGYMAIELATGAEPRPAFVADLYAPVRRWVHIPSGAPPLFTAIAVNDPLFGKIATQSFDLWRAANVPVELHVYETGGHGFGLKVQGTTSDGWIDDFYRWMAAHGWTKRQ